MSNNWTKIAEFSDNIKAELMNAALHGAGIPTQIMDKRDSVYTMLGAYEIFVPNDRAEEGREILKKILTDEEE